MQRKIKGIIDVTEKYSFSTKMSVIDLKYCKLYENRMVSNKGRETKLHNELHVIYS